MESNLIPVDLEAEKKLCGSLIIDTDSISDVMITIRPDFFISSQGQYIYEAICSLYIDGHPVTPDTIANFLNDRKEIDQTRLEIIGGAKGIMETIEGIGDDEVAYWSNAVKKKHEERQLLEFANHAREIALSSPKDISEARSKLESQLVSLSGENGSNSVSIEVAMPDLATRIERYIEHPDEIIGMPTTFTKLDEALDGLQPGNVTILYAPSSRYKSLFSANIGWHLAEQNYPGLWFTTEMPRVQVMERLLQLEAGLNIKWLRRDRRIPEFKAEIAAAQRRLMSYPIYFCDTSALDVSEIRADINRHSRWNNIKYAIIDLIDHVSSSRYRDEMVNNQRAVMASMKQIAKDFNIHLIVVSHVSKGNEQTRRKADLDVEEMIGSSAKYQDVDASISIAPVRMDDMGRWIAMDRDDILWKVANGGIVDVMIAVTKNRHGELMRDILELNFNHGGRFYDNFRELFRSNEENQQSSFLT